MGMGCKARTAAIAAAIARICKAADRPSPQRPAAQEPMQRFLSRSQPEAPSKAAQAPGVPTLARQVEYAGHWRPRSTALAGLNQGAPAGAGVDTTSCTRRGAPRGALAWPRCSAAMSASLG